MCAARGVAALNSILRRNLLPASVDNADGNASAAGNVAGSSGCLCRIVLRYGLCRLRCFGEDCRMIGWFADNWFGYGRGDNAEQSVSYFTHF